MEPLEKNWIIVPLDNVTMSNIPDIDLIVTGCIDLSEIDSLEVAPKISIMFTILQEENNTECVMIGLKLEYSDLERGPYIYMFSILENTETFIHILDGGKVLFLSSDKETMMSTLTTPEGRKNGLADLLRKGSAHYYPLDIHFKTLDEINKNYGHRRAIRDAHKFCEEKNKKRSTTVTRFITRKELDPNALEIPLYPNKLPNYSNYNIVSADQIRRLLIKEKVEIYLVCGCKELKGSNPKEAPVAQLVFLSDNPKVDAFLGLSFTYPVLSKGPFVYMFSAQQTTTMFVNLLEGGSALFLAADRDVVDNLLSGCQIEEVEHRLNTLARDGGVLYAPQEHHIQNLSVIQNNYGHLKIIKDAHDYTNQNRQSLKQKLRE